MEASTRRDREYVKTLYGDNPRDGATLRMGSGSTVELLDIAVNSCRGVGRGTALLAKCIACAKAANSHLLYAFVRVSNEAAVRFYVRNGFAELARIPAFYVEEDARLMGRRL